MKFWNKDTKIDHENDLEAYFDDECMGCTITNICYLTFFNSKSI